MFADGNIADMLKKKGLRNTKQRIVILKILSESSQPLSAEAIYINLIEQGITINLSTIYRVLNTLTEKNIIAKNILASDNKAVYELARKEHIHHFVCVLCKRMFNVEDCPIKAFEEELSINEGFEVTGHKLEMYGYCKDCKVINYNDTSM